MVPGKLGGIRANCMKVLVIPMSLISPFKARVEQPTHDLLVVGNMSITVQPENVGFSDAMAVRDGEGCMAHATNLVLDYGVRFHATSLTCLTLALGIRTPRYFASCTKNALRRPLM